jgi:folate-binding protein YgfZ
VTAPQTPFALTPGSLSPGVADAALRHAVAASPEVAVLEISGPGAVACLQGLLTNDLEQPGPGAFLYGAVLTPKGMIICDLWVERGRAGARLIVPRQGTEALRELFRRTLPPRLARVTESADLAVIQLAGPRAADVAAAAGLTLPAEGRWESVELPEAGGSVARAPAGAPFGIQIVVPRAQGAGMIDRLSRAGAAPSDPAALELVRVLAGWPRLGAEIDEKTLPQEVRYDEIGGVSYTKGCYTGQETVARVHFRGHANRSLRGLSWSGEPDVTRADLEQEGRPRGRVSSLAWLPSGAVVGLGVMRREVEPDSTVLAAGAEARVVALPFGPA